MSGSSTEQVAADGTPAGGEVTEEVKVAGTEGQGQGSEVQKTESASQNPPWFQKRIDQLTARLRQEESAHVTTKQELTLVRAAHGALEQELARLKAGAAPSHGNQPPPTPAGEGVGLTPSAGVPRVQSQEELDALVEQRAAEKLAIQKANQAELDSIERGRAQYPDFDAVVANLRSLGGMPPDAFNMAIESGNAENIIYALGKDLNLASNVLEMPMAKMALEFAKLAKPPGEKPSGASKAPPPMKPLNGGAGAPPVDLAG